MEKRNRLRGLTILAVAAVAGCAGNTPAQGLARSLNDAKVTLDVTRTADAMAHAQAELTVAEEKLSAARSELAQNNYTNASRRLAEARINLSLARAKVDAARAKGRLDADPQPERAAGSTAEGQ